jgi:hypothetical protein
MDQVVHSDGSDAVGQYRADIGAGAVFSYPMRGRPPMMFRLRAA